MLLRLGQHRTVRGRKTDTSRGLKYLDCGTCNKVLQRARGCHRFGQSHSGPEWRIDFTDDISADTVHWCPASVLDFVPLSLFGCLSLMLRVERSGGALATFGTPILLLPTWWVRFFDASVAARDRFLRELDDAYYEAS